MTTEQIITRDYLTEIDKQRIQTQLKGYVITLRPCGEDTLMRLSAGAGAKPHGIMEKTVKYAKNIENDIDGTNEIAAKQACYQKLKAAFGEGNEETGYNFCRGFAGHWDAVGNLEGLYLTSYGKQELSLTGLQEHIIKNKDYYYLSLRDKALERANTVQENQNWERFFFTGDYDLHDQIQKVSGWNYLIEGTSDFKKFLQEINNVINCNTDGIPDKYKKEYNRVQHGAQFNYISYVLGKELKKDGVGALIKTVMQVTLPLAAFKDGVWSILRTKTEYESFITSMGLEPKHIWKDERSMTSFIDTLEDVYGDKLEIKQ